MVINNCKHDGGFLLCYSEITTNYSFACVRCKVFKLPFNPDIFPEGVAYPNNVKMLAKQVELHSMDTGKVTIEHVKFIVE